MGTEDWGGLVQGPRPWLAESEPEPSPPWALSVVSVGHTCVGRVQGWGLESPCCSLTRGLLGMTLSFAGWLGR